MQHILWVLLMATPVPLWASRTTGKIIPVLYSYNSTFNPKMVNGSIQFYNIKGRKDSPLVGVSMYPVKPVTEAWIHATFSIISKKGRMHAPIYNSKADFCDFLRQPSKYHIMSLVYNEVRRFGRIPSRCPIMPSWYMFSNISLRQIQLPSFLSEADFLATIVGYIPGKEQYLRFQFVGALKKV
ncbi:AGAP010993-PA-like protein [Anopheles sinensis]|uniref:AGAP010993-PA-like protein n=1 Tax=Anopheles sinensis TaxID=74873 RepID=A0A084W991_ANOSI|nr:AGAP010993-PA-like protein [Anopheles sinensis]